jgi:hypothetical protein
MPQITAWYKLDGNFKDSSGNGYDLTPASPDQPFSKDIYIMSKDNKCFGPIITTNGSSGATGPVLPLSNQKGFTICGFAALPKQNSYSATLFGCGKSRYRRNGALIFCPWGVIHTKVGATNQHRYERLNDGKWHHYALVIPPESKDQYYRLYIDGKEVYKAYIQRKKQYGKFLMGLINGRQQTGFKLDEIKVFDGALSEEQIKHEAKLNGSPQPETLTSAGIPRRIPPANYNFPFKGELKMHFLTNRWLCIVGNYNDFMRKRFKIECGRFLELLDKRVIKVKRWSYNFHYNFAAIEVISAYRPRIKKFFENPENFKLQEAGGKKVSFEKHSYWINAIGQMRVPIIATGELKMVNSAAVAHFAFLKTTEPLINGKKYILNSKYGDKLEFVYDDRELLSQALKVNQVGYLPDAGKKYAYLGAWLGPSGPLKFDDMEKQKFFLIEEKTGKKVFSGPIKLRTKEQYYTGTTGLKVPLNGEITYELDFSKFKTPGKYHVYVPGVGRSWSFEISRDAIGKSFYTHIRGLFHQRSGIGKAPPNTNWIMGADHMASWIGGFSPETSDYNTIRKDGSGYLNQEGKPIKINHFTVIKETATDIKLPNVHGGWWDAGDFDRRPYHFRIVGDLLSAYLMFPEKFKDGQQDIPESGNGIPDIVDEAVWGVDVWRRAQNSNGGVGCWLEATSHPKQYNPAKDKQRYYLALPTRRSTIQYSAYSAMLANVLKKCGQTKKSTSFLISAEKAFDYAINPVNRVKYSWKHYLNKEKKYVEYTFIEPPEIDQTMVFKAAFNLYILTGKVKYKEFLNKERFDLALRQTEYPKTLFFLTEIYTEKHEFDKYKSAYEKEIFRRADTWLKYQEDLTYRNLNWPTTHPFFRNLAWGNAIPFNKGRYFISAYRISRNLKYRDAALLLNDWLCGANPMGRSMTTGLGQNRPIRVLSLPSYADGILQPLPGITPYTFTFRVNYNAKKMVYALNYPPRKDHNFNGVNICLMPDSVSQGKNMDYNQISAEMDKLYPVWRRFANIEEFAVPQNEFTVWETIAPCAACLGCLLPDNWMPPQDWKSIKPLTKLKDMKGYLFQP